ncbi:hypothetical protein [Mycobacterium sp. AT1]|uniref:hypothetical protein n=1 Tax=Mycobacterium sp. AT1 TaxID=1961706 RepID=UPI001152C631|nr:hypothetical protein [Mycobacterium sp. AT1]
MDQRHGIGVDRALITAALFWAALAPTMQCLLIVGNSDDLDRLPIIALAFGSHAVVWTLVLLKRLAPPALLVTWAVIGVAVAAQAATGATELLRAALNIGISASILAGLLLGLPAALSSSFAISLAICASLAVSVVELTPYAFSYLVLLPLNSLASACAAGVAIRELRSVAREADLRARIRLTADRSLARKKLEADAGRRRARLLHDTVVNTLGAIATGRIVSQDDVIARRCADDVRAVDALQRRRDEAATSIDDIVVHARTMGVDLRTIDPGGLRRWLADQPGWQLRGILSTVQEAATNVAKHANVTEASLEYFPRTGRVVLADAGSGMGDAGPARSSMATRAQDAGLYVTVTSVPGQGTAVAIEVPPQPPVVGSDVFERASSRMATGISAVMLAQFAAVIVVTATLRTGWSVAAVTPAVLLWLIVAAALTLILRHAGEAAGLPLLVVAATYLLLACGMVIYGLSRPAQSVCGVHPNLGWAGDAAAAICAALVLLDGRMRVVVPALAIIAFGSMVALHQDAARCGGSTVALLVADALVVGAFVVMRQQVRRLSDAVASQIDDEMRGRRQQERLAAEIAIRSTGFDGLIDDAREILRTVSQRPSSIRDPDVRAAASLEESYLRALIGLPYESGDVTEAFVGIIDAAKRARVRLDINVEEGTLDAVAARAVSRTVIAVLAACDPDEAVSVGVFRSAGGGEMILLAPASATAAGPDVLAASFPGGVDVRCSDSDGLVEIRW